MTSLAHDRPRPATPVAELVAACLRHEPGACRRLYLEHVESVHRFVARMGVAPDAIEDLVQDVFVVAFRRLATFEGSSSISTWLYAIALRRARTHRRWRWRHRLVELVGLASEEGADRDAAERRPDAEDDVARRELAEDLQWVLERLPVKQRVVVVLHDIEELSVPEVAAVAGCPVPTVWSRLRLGREEMRKMMRRRMTLRGMVP
jgi:RNA polymerase sigma-70 factor (ECF subfamily)